MPTHTPQLPRLRSCPERCELLLTKQQEQAAEMYVGQSLCFPAVEEPAVT